MHTTPITLLVAVRTSQEKEAEFFYFEGRARKIAELHLHLKKNFFAESFCSHSCRQGKWKMTRFLQKVSGAN